MVMGHTKMDLSEWDMILSQEEINFFWISSAQGMPFYLQSKHDHFKHTRKRRKRIFTPAKKEVTLVHQLTP